MCDYLTEVIRLPRNTMSSKIHAKREALRTVSVSWEEVTIDRISTREVMVLVESSTTKRKAMIKSVSWEQQIIN